MTLRQDRETKCVRIRGEFLLTPDSKACLMRLKSLCSAPPPLLPRHYRIVEAVVGEAGVTIDAGVSQGCVLIAAEGEDSGV